MFLRRALLGSATLLGALALLPGLTPSVRGAELSLVTQDEAKLPPAKGAVPTERRGITRGPKVVFVDKPEPAHSPMHFQVTFESFGGAKIDPDSVKVTYLKTPNVDLTPRVKPFVQTAGIDIPDATLPAGDHLMRVDVKDSDGRAGTSIFVLKVAP